jgi:hypothetical protein
MTPRRRPLAPVWLLVPLLLTACAGTGERGASGSRDVITQEQLQGADFQSYTAFEAIQRLRPTWLRPRGTTMTGVRPYAEVIVDGTPYGGLEILRSIRVGDVGEIRYLSAVDATTLYGTGYVGGAIEVSTRR